MIEDYQWPLLSRGRGLKYQCKGKVFTIHGSLSSRGVRIEMPSLGPTKAMRTDALFVGVWIGKTVTNGSLLAANALPPTWKPKTEN